MVKTLKEIREERMKKKNEKMNKLTMKPAESVKGAEKQDFKAGEKKMSEKEEKGAKTEGKEAELKKTGGKIKSEKNEIRKDDKKAKKTTKKRPMGTANLFFYFMIGMFVLSFLYFLVSRNASNAFIIFSSGLLLFSVYLLIKKRLKKYYEVKKMELVFPDFISLMASNLRAGMTVDRALILSARAEFAPLDKEIMQVGKDILTAREISQALYDMGERIGSNEIKKTIQLIISGIRSGGNLSILLEQTSTNMRERNFVRKRAASNVLMYVIFIFFAVAVGAPLLFGLSSVLVEIMTKLFAEVPAVETNVNLPFTIKGVNVSLGFVIFFSVFFIIASSILASLILGLVSNGNEKEGLKFIIPLMVIGLIVFFVARTLLSSYFTRSFG